MNVLHNILSLSYQPHQAHVPTRGPESAAVRVTNHRLMTPAKICYCHMRLVAAVVGEMFLMVLQFD